MHSLNADKEKGSDTNQEEDKINLMAKLNKLKQQINKDELEEEEL